MKFSKHLFVYFGKKVKLEHCQICSPAEKKKMFQLVDLKKFQAAIDPV